MNKNFIASVKKFAHEHPNQTYALAVSGGADSMALLHWMKKTGLDVVAITVDHGLRPESEIEAQQVAKACANLYIPHTTLLWTGKKPKTGLEEAARKARYDLMIEYCKKNKVGVLVTAHQADDQIETFFMNLGRGSGVYGLAGMRKITKRDGIVIFRPMLGVPRTGLSKYCKDNGIKYFNDAMNDDDNFHRVKVRKNRQALGLSDERILLAIENLGRARDYIESRIPNPEINIPIELDAHLLLDFPDELRFRTLSRILSREHPIRLNNIKRAFEMLDTGKAKFTLAGCNIRILNGKIRIWKEGEKWQKRK